MIDASFGSTMREQRYSLASSALLVLGEGEDGAEAQAAIEAVGTRLLGTVALSEAVDRLDRIVSVDTVVVEAGSGRGDEAELLGLLARLNARAAEGGSRSVVTLAPHLIDPAIAVASHGDITLLCNPTLADRVAAQALASVPHGFALHDISRDPGAVRLAQLSEEVGRIAAALARLAEGGPGGQPASVIVPVGGAPLVASLTSDVATAIAGTIRAMLRARRAREQFFRVELFADPAWDMLLDLTAARLEHQRVSVSSLCIAAAVPPTTALRWIKALTDEGVLMRRADPTDGRRIFVELGEPAFQAMVAYLGWLQANAALAV